MVGRGVLLKVNSRIEKSNASYGPSCYVTDALREVWIFLEEEYGVSLAQIFDEVKIYMKGTYRTSKKGGVWLGRHIFQP